MNRRTKIAIGVSAACTVLAGQNAVAQDTLEEVIVTGIRGSMTAALDVKRDSSGVVDAISAEDIGKFPDTNLAESLQRITGVSIDRNEGEGSQVTIRGFGGEFNLVTLNGRQMPATDARALFFGLNSNRNSGDSRSFDFSNIASEGVSGIQVYKTGRASAPSGGMGGTINIQTLRPLDTGNTFTAGVKLVDDAGGDDITPEVSALGSWVNDEGNFGITAFGSVQDRDYSNRTALGGGFFVWQTAPVENIQAFSNATIVNPPEVGQLTGFIPNASMTYAEGDRERTNLAVTMEFEPNDDLSITVDGVYTSNELSSWNIGDLPFYVRQFDFAMFDDHPDVSVPLLLGEPLVAGAGSDPTQAGKELPFRNGLINTKDDILRVLVHLNVVLPHVLAVWSVEIWKDQVV